MPQELGTALTDIPKQLVCKFIADFPNSICSSYAISIFQRELPNLGIWIEGFVLS
jgi:hypothetical protein